MSDLLGKAAIVTGSSSGIGRAIALELAAAGADVLIHTRANRIAADEVAHLVCALGRRSAVVQADLADTADQNMLMTESARWSDTIDIWVNNAGADVLTGEAAQWSFARKLDQLYRVDVAATIHLSREIGARMLRTSAPAGSHCILNMGWDQSQVGMGGDSGEMFSAVKGAVMAFSRSLAKSLAPTVRVNCLAPGWIRTRWGETASEYWQQGARSESLLDRWGTPEDVAHVARFLASPAAQYITGQVVAINGGFTG